MAKLFVVFVLTLCMARVTFGINCFTCNSTKSARECFKQQKHQHCPSREDQCRTSFITIKTGKNDTKREFLKHCSSKAVCDQAKNTALTLCKEYNGTCLERCCNHEYCNELDGGPAIIKCYQCFSNKSWNECDRVRKVVTCRFDEYERCARLILTGKRGDQTIKTYSELCLPRDRACVADDCGEKLSDPSILTTRCSVHCCDFDLCNGASANMVSAIILLACALQAVLR